MVGGGGDDETYIFSLEILTSANQCWGRGLAALSIIDSCGRKVLN